MSQLKLCWSNRGCGDMKSMPQHPRKHGSEDIYLKDNICEINMAYMKYDDHNLDIFNSPVK